MNELRRPRPPHILARSHRAVLAFALALFAVSASAQHESAREADPRERAAAHFDRGIEFFNEGRYDASLAELGRAYELFPAHQTLYNIARVQAALGRSVDAARTYERYLEEAGEAISAGRRREAERALAEQRSRIGRLHLRTEVGGARVAIDGVDVATTPLSEPIELSAGSHTVEVRAPGRETVRRAVAIAGQDEVTLEVTLREVIVPRGTLRIVSALPDVRIEVNGERVGSTPLPSTLPLRAGEHEVRASRRGYLPERQRVLIEDGAQAEARFALERDPEPAPDEVGRVRIALPEAPYLLRIDGEPTLGLELELPIGQHRIELEVTDRQPYEGTLQVLAGRELIVAPPLSWTLEARRARIESAAAQRTAGAALSIVGGALALAGLPLLAWNEAEIPENDRRIVELNAQYAALGCARQPVDHPTCQSLYEEGERRNDLQDQQNILRAATITSTVLGVLLASVGVPLWLTAPSESEIDAAAGAHATLHIGPGGIGITGAF